MKLLRREVDRHRTELMREIHILTDLDHSNIIAFRGACSSGLFYDVSSF